MFHTTALKIPNLLPLRSNDIRALVKLGKYTDLDNRINTPNIFHTIKKTLNVSFHTARQIVSHLKACGFLNQSEDGFYYSNFSKRGNSVSNSYQYIPYFSLFDMKDGNNFDVFRHLKERELKLFFYILTSAIPGRYHNVSAEIMYMNKTKKKDVKLTFFDSYREFSSFLRALIDKDLLQVRFSFNQRDYYIHKGNCDTAFPILDEYCGALKNARKKRFTKEGTHVLQIRINPSLIFCDESQASSTDNPLLSPKDPEDRYNKWKHKLERRILTVYESRSTIQDIVVQAEKYNHDIDWLQQRYSKEFHSIHILKSKLHETYGTVGVSIFRTAVESYFAATPENFSVDIEDGHFARNLENYYILPTIRQTFLDEVRPFLDAVREGNCSNIKTSALFHDINFDLADGLLKSINFHEYEDHKVLLSADLSAYSEGVSLLEETLPQLKKLKADICFIYGRHASKGVDADEVLQRASQFILNARKWEHVDERDSIIGGTVNQQAIESSENPPIYNWLEE